MFDLANSLLGPIAGVLVVVTVQVIVFRLRRGAQFFQSIAQGVLSGAGVFGLLEMYFVINNDASTDRLAVALLVNAPTFFALCYCYYNFAQLGQTSIRIRLYSTIISQPLGVSLEEIERKYNEDVLTRVRLERLIESGDVTERNGRYFVGRTRFVYVANAIFAARRLIFGKRTATLG